MQSPSYCLSFKTFQPKSPTMQLKVAPTQAAALESCENLLEMQNINHIPELPNQSLHSNKISRWSECTFKFESTSSKDFLMIYRIWKDDH